MVRKLAFPPGPQPSPFVQEKAEQQEAPGPVPRRMEYVEEDVVEVQQVRLLICCVLHVAARCLRADAHTTGGL
jgi:hypothetical protein